MDDETRQHLEAMEARLMTRINDNHSAVLIELRNLRSEHETVRRFVMGLPGLLVSALEAGFIDRMTRLEARIDKLEGDESR